MVFVLTFSSMTAFAEGETTDSTNQDQSVQDSVYEEPGMTPDNVLYPIEKMIESIQVVFTFSDEDKAELLVKFANERLSEAQIMSEEGKQQLLVDVLNAYVKTIDEANEKLENAVGEDKDITGIIESIKFTEDAAGNVIIEANGTIPEEISAELNTAITDVVKKTIVIEALSTSKSNFEQAKELVDAAKEELEKAKETGDEALIKAAEEKLALAEENKDQMEQAKEEVNQYKEEIVSDIKNEDKDQKEVEKIEKKIEKMQSLVIKQQEKRQEMVEKLTGKPGKAAEKIEENTKKQLDKKNTKINQLKESLDAIMRLQKAQRFSSRIQN
jgi:hypothetical protein